MRIIKKKKKENPFLKLGITAKECSDSFKELNETLRKLRKLRKHE